ncbi:UNVERIFIED_CONTAM: Brefeldin A-inhibited guanine nucleotide-exchange protein 2 [Sesamum angustifolium]|uniref:Brefeldin A-inhibited guanine nucleotide-exchange protein 2 n=1 Tax=Sesamum angustifolium TaxID=2727405 RepID=A0AAW2N8P8_9LAMI
MLSRLIDSTCKCHDLGDENVELLVIKTLLTAVTSCALRIHGDCLLQVVKTCYHIYIISKNVVNQTTAKASLVQMLVIVFRRMEADSSTVPLQPIVVAELMEPLEKTDADGSTAIFVQGFITKIMQDIDGVFSPSTPGGRVSGLRCMMEHLTLRHRVWRALLLQICWTRQIRICWMQSTGKSVCIRRHWRKGKESWRMARGKGMMIWRFRLEYVETRCIFGFSGFV